VPTTRERWSGAGLEAEPGRLAGTGRPDRGYEFAVADADADVVQGGDVMATLPVAFRNASQFEQRHLTVPIDSGRHPNRGRALMARPCDPATSGKRCTPFAATVSLTVHGAK
jgi:hypothetical protein